MTDLILQTEILIGSVLSAHWLLWPTLLAVIGAAFFLYPTARDEAERLIPEMTRNTRYFTVGYTGVAVLALMLVLPVMYFEGHGNYVEGLQDKVAECEWEGDSCGYEKKILRYMNEPIESSNIIERWKREYRHGN